MSIDNRLEVNIAVKTIGVPSMKYYNMDTIMALLVPHISNGVVVNKINAIKAVRDTYDWSLRDAKDVVEAFMSMMAVGTIHSTTVWKIGR